jgi:hypothetical protein
MESLIALVSLHNSLDRLCLYLEACLLLTVYPTCLSITPFQRGEDWVILAGDRNQARSIVKMKTDEDKMRVVGSHQVIAFNGEAGQFVALLIEETTACAS